MRKKKKVLPSAKMLLSVMITAALLLTLGKASVAFAADRDVPLTPQNGIPLLIVRVDETGDNATIDQMNESPDHSVRCVGTAQFIVPEGYVSEYGGKAPEQQILLEYIRGRGNSTWEAPKKPYKIKFAGKDKSNEGYLTGKQDLFGMGKSREWALLAESYDESLIKNRVTSWLGQTLSFKFTPQAVPVDLVMIGADENGETASYLGTYTISELIDVGESGVDIDEIDENAGAEPEITGGYLLSFFNDLQDTWDDSANFRTEAGVELTIEAPEYEGAPEELSRARNAQREYIAKYVQTLEDLIVKSETIDEATHNKIAAMMDLDTAADYWWMHEFTRNGDAFITGSSYFYKERSGKLYWGPLWDFDNAYGMKNEESPLYGLYDGLNNSESLWFDQLRAKDPLFTELLIKRWKEVFDGKLEQLLKDGGVIDRYYEQMRASQAADYAVWSAVYPDGNYGSEDYKAAVNTLKEWISNRRGWINDNLDRIGKVYVTVRFKVNGEYLEGKDKTFRLGSAIGEWDAPEAPRKKGVVYSGWVEEKSAEPIDDYVLKDDAVFVPNYIPEELAVAPTGLYFVADEKWAPLSGEQTTLADHKVLPEDTTDPVVTWSSSDESIASFDESNNIHLLRVGDVVITGTLYNGVSYSYTLHVFDSDKTPVQFVQEVVPKNSELTVHEGESIQIKYSLKPEATPLSTGYVSFQVSESSDQDVIEVNGTGVITGLKAGTAEVVLTVSPDYSSMPFDADETLSADRSATIKVTVTKKSDQPADPTKPTEPSEKKIRRLGGDDRFGTANMISAEGWDSADTVVIAAAANYPDALAGAVLAKKLNAPILLAKANGLDDATMKEIERLRAKNAVILGGTAAVGEGVEKELRDKNIKSRRIAGATRNDTAAMIAYLVADHGAAAETTAADGKADTIFLVSNASFADALSVSPAAALRSEPILYLNSDGTIPAATGNAISALGAKKAFIIGGTAAIGSSAESALSKLGVVSTRVCGATRYETAVAVYDTFKTEYKSGSAAVATGLTFPDALAGGAFSARVGMPVFLIDNAPAAGLADRLKGVDTLYVFGGHAAVPESAVDMLTK